MLNDRNTMARLLMFCVEPPRTDANHDVDKVELFCKWLKGKLENVGVASTTVYTYRDFETLMTTGNFDVGVVGSPHYLVPNEWERLCELIPNIASMLKGFVVLADNQWQEFPAEYGVYGNVVQLFNSSKIQPDVVLEHIVDRLEYTDTRPSNILIPTWKTATLNWKPAPPAFIKSFDEWPPEVATACEQYLLYFREFLADIGIKSTTNLAHEAGEVLFSVVPDDPEEALDAIHDALALYLRLPVITEDTSVAVTDDISALRLQSQIDHTKSQMMLAAATIRQQQATIETQEIAISLLKGANPATDILLSAAKPEAKKPTSEEVIWGGLVKFGDLDLFKGGIKIACGEIIRRGKSAVAERRAMKKLRTEVRMLECETDTEPSDGG